MKLAEFIGKKIKISGTIAENPYQHLIQFNLSYPHINYINLENGDQIVVYSSKPLKQTLNKMLNIKGTVMSNQNVYLDLVNEMNHGWLMIFEVPFLGALIIVLKKYGISKI